MSTKRQALYRYCIVNDFLSRAFRLLLSGFRSENMRLGRRNFDTNLTRTFMQWYHCQLPNAKQCFVNLIETNFNINVTSTALRIMNVSGYRLIHNRIICLEVKEL